MILNIVPRPGFCFKKIHKKSTPTLTKKVAAPIDRLELSEIPSAEGISLNSSLSIGAATFFVSVGVLFLWIFLKQKPGLGTIFNIIVIAAMIDFTLNYFQPPSSLFTKYLLAVLSVILVGLGSGIYLVANLGPGPRDGLMTGLTKTTNLPIALVRAFLEITVVIIGWYLGGTVGVGTLIFAFGIGPCVALGLFLVGKIFN